VFKAIYVAPSSLAAYTRFITWFERHEFVPGWFSVRRSRAFGRVSTTGQPGLVESGLQHLLRVASVKVGCSTGSVQGSMCYAQQPGSLYAVLGMVWRS
jgi:hypothetical protein